MTFKEMAQGLLLPIRRRPRSPPKDHGNSASNEVEPDNTAGARSEGNIESTTFSQKRTSSFIPSSGARYTVHTTPTNYDPFRFVPKSSSPLKPGMGKLTSAQAPGARSETPSRIQGHARNFSAPSLRPLPLVPEPHSTQRMRPVQALPNPDDIEVLLAEEQIVRVTIPTPFPSPVPGQPGVDHNYYPAASESAMQVWGSTTFPAATTDMAHSSLRPLSRDSSHSSRDRAHPPPSFPITFYDRLRSSQEPLKVPKRTRQGQSPSSRPGSASKRYTISGMPSQEINSHRSGIDPPEEFIAGEREQLSRGGSPTSTISMSPTKSQHSYFGSRDVRSNRTDSDLSPARPRHDHRGSAHASSDSDLSFHTTVHYYTNCTHTSPPASRPLDTQPHMRTLPPDHHQHQQPTTRSFISGSCFDCDTALRRDEETQILLLFNPEISRLSEELEHLVTVLENPAPGTLHDHSRPQTPSDQTFGPPLMTNSASASSRTGTSVGSRTTTDTEHANLSTDTTSPPSSLAVDTYETIGQQIQQLERWISGLNAQRVDEVDRVWQGYSTRWGPGTLGVVRTAAPGVTTSRSVSRSGSYSRPVSISQSIIDTASFEEYHEYPRNTSRTSSVQVSPQKAQFPQNLYTEHNHGTHDLKPLPMTPVAQRNLQPFSSGLENSHSLQNITRTPTRSLQMSLSQHGRGRSTDSAASSIRSGIRSASRTETGISYASTDTPVGRMKVNWVRDLG